MIAGHEKPDIEELKHKRVTWLTVDFPPPSNHRNFTNDKMRKRKVIGAYLRKIGYSGLFMPLDADDWVHCDFVEYVRSRPHSDAYILKKGLMVNLASKEVWLRKKRFFRGCGSGAAFYFSNREFPKTTDMEDVRKTPFRIVLKGHPKVIRHLKAINKSHTMIDFPFIAWVLGHGDNNSMIKGKKDNRVSASKYGAVGEKLDKRLYEYFKIRKIKK